MCDFGSGTCSPACVVPNCRCIQGQGLGIVVWSLAKINYDASRVRHLLQAFAQVGHASTVVASMAMEILF